MTAPEEKNKISSQSPEDISPQTGKLKILYNESLPKGQLTITEAADRTKAYLEIVNTTSSEQFTKDEILEVINEIGIKSVIDVSKIEESLTTLKDQGDTVQPITIADSAPPAGSQNNEAKILFSPDDPFVEEGEMVLKVSGAEKTVSDIFGNEIALTNSEKSNITLGENVIEKDPGEYFSKCIGRASFKSNIISIKKLLEIRVSKDSMAAKLSYTGATKLTYTKIMDEVRAKGIKFGVDETLIDNIVADFEKEAKHIEDIVIARGKKRVEGREGEIKYSFIAETDNPSFKEKNDGSIDIRETNVIQTVSEGDEIATITPSIPSENGKDVFGKAYNVPKIKEIAIKPDKGVRATADGLHFFAEISGRPVLETDMLGLKLGVDEVFSVKGDLDLKTGNIDFNGIVEIDGDVEDGFSVKATKSIFISGCVGACNIEAGTNLTVQGGCNGKEQANIYTGGDIVVKYLNETTVKSRGNILAINEIVNSDINTLGRVTIKTGSTRGGKIFAKMGVESYDIGSEMGVKTILVPGADYELNAECETIDKKIIAINKDLEDINKRIAPLLKNKELLPNLPEEQRNKLMETIDYLTKLKEEKDSLNETKSALIEQSRSDSLPEAVAHNIVYQSVIIKIYESRREIASLLEGPLKMYDEDERILVEPYGEKARKRSEEKMLEVTKRNEEAAKEAAQKRKEELASEARIEKGTGKEEEKAE